MGDKDSLQQAEVTIVDACCCKQGADPLCLYCCACRIVPVSVLIKGQAQTCCCVTGVAIPPDAEVPCMIGTLGIVCYPSFGVCKKMKDITGNDPSGGGGDAVGA